MLEKMKLRKGFTLIEVVIVLAIAALIFVIVFLAVTGAQRSRRDTHRKSDLNRMAAQLENYASNNNGVYPTPTTAALATAFGPGAGSFVDQYLSNAGDFLDPSTGQIYSYNTVAAGGAIPACPGKGNVYYTQLTNNSRSYSITMCLETGTLERHQP